MPLVRNVKVRVRVCECVCSGVCVGEGVNVVQQRANNIPLTLAGSNKNRRCEIDWTFWGRRAGEREGEKKGIDGRAIEVSDRRRGVGNLGRMSRPGLEGGRGGDERPKGMDGWGGREVMDAVGGGRCA